MAKRKDTTLPPFVYSGRKGQYQIMVTIDGERLVVGNTTSLEAASAISALLQPAHKAFRRDVQKAGMAFMAKAKTIQNFVKTTLGKG